MAISRGKIITVTSVKGGTGKTTTVLNLAGVFANLQKKVLIIDIDLYSGAIAASLNVDNTNDIYKLVDDMVNNRFDYIENYVSTYNEFIDVLPAPKDPRYASRINSKYISIILNKASMKYDIVLIDTNHNLDAINLVTLDASDQILYLLTNDPIDLKNMKTMLSIYRDMGKTNYKLILNDSIDRLRNYFNTYDIKNIIKDNIDYTIPNSFYIKTIDKYVLDGKILTLDKGIQKANKKAMKNFELIAKNILKEKKK